MLTESVLAGATVWVVLNWDLVVGYLVFDRLLEVSQILALGIDPKHQRKGVASTLFERYANAQRESGALEVLLEVAANNQAAIKLYQGLGFARVGLRRGYYRANNNEGPTDALVLKFLL